MRSPREIGRFSLGKIPKFFGWRSEEVGWLFVERSHVT
jgi:hypothetical protein